MSNCKMSALAIYLIMTPYYVVLIFVKSLRVCPPTFKTNKFNSQTLCPGFTTYFRRYEFKLLMSPDKDETSVNVKLVSVVKPGTLPYWDLVASL